MSYFGDPVGYSIAIQSAAVENLTRLKASGAWVVMKNMVWNTIAHLPGCRPLTLPKGYGEFFLFQTSVDDTGWLVGPYKTMTPFATDLRDDEGLRDFLSANRVRLGLRDTDVPPAEIERQRRSGPLVRGPNHDKDFTLARASPVAPPVEETSPVSINRRTDREENVRRFWASQTPQSHHIVEFNNLEKLEASQRVGSAEMDYRQLPAVLLAAEFHQRYISDILRPAQLWGKQQLRSAIASVYRSLYLGRGPLFEPLWRVSRVILEEAGIKTA
jgi:hypothetical protein